jgi:hypothetical protein
MYQPFNMAHADALTIPSPFYICSVLWHKLALNTESCCAMLCCAVLCAGGGHTVRYYNLPNQRGGGLYQPLNMAVRGLVASDWIAYLKDSAVWKPHHLSTLVSSICFPICSRLRASGTRPQSMSCLGKYGGCGVAWQ